jgi:hypothetical protein
VTLSSSDTKEASELLYFGSGHVISSRPLVADTQELLLSSSAGSDWFEDWPEANDVAADIYVALLVGPSSSYQMQADASCQS